MLELSLNIVLLLVELGQKSLSLGNQLIFFCHCGTLVNDFSLQGLCFDRKLFLERQDLVSKLRVFGSKPVDLGLKGIDLGQDTGHFL